MLQFVAGERFSAWLKILEVPVLGEQRYVPVWNIVHEILKESFSGDARKLIPLVKMRGCGELTFNDWTNALMDRRIPKEFEGGSDREPLLYQRLVVSSDAVTHFKKRISEKTGIPQPTFEESIGKIKKFLEQLHKKDCFMDVWFFQNCFGVCTLKPQGPELCCYAGNHIFGNGVSFGIIDYWNNIFMDITNMRDAFTAERLGMAHQIVAVVDGKALFKETFKDKNIPLVVSLQTDENYVAQTAVAINSIRTTTPGKKTVIIWGIGLSENEKEWFQNFSDENTLIIVENVKEEWIKKAEEYRTRYGIACNLRIFYPKMMEELFREITEKADPEKLSEFGLGESIEYFLHCDSDIICFVDLKKDWEALPYGFTGAAADLWYCSSDQDRIATIITGLKGVNCVTYRPSLGVKGLDLCTSSYPSGGIAIYSTKMQSEETAQRLKEFYRGSGDPDDGEGTSDNPSDEDVMQNMPGWFLFLSSTWNPQWDVLCPAIAKPNEKNIKMSKEEWIERCLEGDREHKFYKISGLETILKNSKFLHFDNCLKPWDPEFIKRCKNNINATILFLRYAEEVRKTNEWLRSKSGARLDKWTEFLERFLLYFSATPAKVVAAFESIDIGPYLQLLGGVPLPFDQIISSIPFGCYLKKYPGLMFFKDGFIRYACKKISDLCIPTEAVKTLVSE